MPAQVTGDNRNGRACREHAQSRLEWAERALRAALPFRKQDKPARLVQQLFFGSRLGAANEEFLLELATAG